MTEVQQQPNSMPHFKVLHGLLFFKDKLYIPENSPVKSVILEEFHSSLLGGLLRHSKNIWEAQGKCVLEWHEKGRD